jgi:hypothetical protein
MRFLRTFGQPKRRNMISRSVASCKWVLLLKHVQRKGRVSTPIIVRRALRSCKGICRWSCAEELLTTWLDVFLCSQKGRDTKMWPMHNWTGGKGYTWEESKTKFQKQIVLTFWGCTGVVETLDDKDTPIDAKPYRPMPSHNSGPLKFRTTLMNSAFHSPSLAIELENAISHASHWSKDR